MGGDAVFLIFFWGNAFVFFEDLTKIAQVVKSAFEGGLRDIFALHGHFVASFFDSQFFDAFKEVISFQKTFPYVRIFRTYIGLKKVTIP